jgi:hypothetical protein
VVTRVDVPVGRRDDVVVVGHVRVDVVADHPGDLGPAGDGQGSALAEVVLDVDDDQGPSAVRMRGSGHGSVLLVDGGDHGLAPRELGGCPGQFRT